VGAPGSQITAKNPHHLVRRIGLTRPPERSLDYAGRAVALVLADAKKAFLMHFFKVLDLSHFMKTSSVLR
jgi:hypothetical protein